MSEKEKVRVWFDAGFSALGGRILLLGTLAVLGYVIYRSHTIVVTLIMAGILACAGCNWTIITTRTTVLPPCPQCSETAFRKTV